MNTSSASPGNIPRANAPLPAATGGGLDTDTTNNKIYLPPSRPHCKCQGLIHVGSVTIKVTLSLILLALTNQNLDPQVREYLESLFICREMNV